MFFLFLEEREDKTRDHNSAASTHCYRELLSVETSGCCYYHQLASLPGIFHLSSPAHLSPSPSLSLSLSLSIPFTRSLPSFSLLSTLNFSSLPFLLDSETQLAVLSSSSFLGVRTSQTSIHSPLPPPGKLFFSPTWNRLNHNIPISYSHHFCYQLHPGSSGIFQPRTSTGQDPSPLNFHFFLTLFSICGPGYVRRASHSLAPWRPPIRFRERTLSTWLCFLACSFLWSWVPCWFRWLRLQLERSLPCFVGGSIARSDVKKGHSIWALRKELGKLTVYVDSYEALPSNYGLGRNMLAGAFAGIAVCLLVYS